MLWKIMSAFLIFFFMVNYCPLSVTTVRVKKNFTTWDL